jgi:hypothetical protein
MTPDQARILIMITWAQFGALCVIAGLLVK